MEQLNWGDGVPLGPFQQCTAWLNGKRESNPETRETCTYMYYTMKANTVELGFAMNVSEMLVMV